MPKQPTADRVTIEISRDGLTNQLQLNIARLDERGCGLGYRLAGPKFNGSSTSLLKAAIDARDATEIRAILDAAFPLTDDQARHAALTEAIRGVISLQQDAEAAQKAGLQAAFLFLHALRAGTPYPAAAELVHAGSDTAHALTQAATEETTR